MKHTEDNLKTYTKEELVNVYFYYKECWKVPIWKVNKLYNRSELIDGIMNTRTWKDNYSVDTSI